MAEFHLATQFQDSYVVHADSLSHCPDLAGHFDRKKDIITVGTSAFNTKTGQNVCCKKGFILCTYGAI